MDYKIVRYEITQQDNGLPQIRLVARGLSMESEPMLTYAEVMKTVLAAVRRELGIADDERDPQTLINRRYHLRLFVRAAGKEEQAAIGDDFGEQFDDLREKAIGLVKGERTRGDVRRGIGWWQERYRELLSANRRGAGIQPTGSFAAVLERNMSKRGVTHARAAKIAGVPSSTLSSWIQGVIPKAKSAAGLRRLETELGLNPDALVAIARQPNPETSPVAPSGYRASLRAQRADRYRLTLPEVGERLQREWRTLLLYKTTRAPRLKRSRRAKWTLTSSAEGRRNVNWHNTFGNGFCAAADIEWKHVTGFFGFLKNKRAEHERTLPLWWEPSLAAFAIPELVERYFAWLIERSGGVVNGRIKTLSNFLQSLTATDTGWLTQQPELRKCLPLDFQTTPWVDACAAVNAIATGYRGEARGTSRDPFEPIRGLLALDEPFAPILQAIRLLDGRAFTAGLQSPTAAIAKRDALLLNLLISVPLRLRNLVLLRYRADGAGTLRKEPDGRWWVRIPAHETKNKKAIEAKLPKSATTRIDEYVTIYRPRLLGTSQCDCVFVASRGDARPWWSLNMRLFSLTKTYIPGCMGFHTHSFRHLVATRWLDLHPEDYLSVAHLLGDDLHTVIKVYSRPSPAKAIDRANQDIDALMA